MLRSAVRFSSACCLLSCLLLTAPGQAQAAPGEDWPTYRHDYARTGYTPAELTPPLSQRWYIAAPKAPRSAWAGPDGRVIEGHALRERVDFDDALHVAIAGNRVYFGSPIDHRLHCVKLSTGEPVWTFFTGGPIRLAPTLADDRVFFGSDDGFVYCLDAQYGTLKWKRRAGPENRQLLARGEMISLWPVRTGVLVDQGIAYFGAGIFPHENIYLYAVRAEDGELLWKKDNISQTDAARDDLSPQGYLLANDQLLVVPSGRSLPAVLDRHTAERLHKRTPGWRNEAGGVVGGARAIMAAGQIFVEGAHHLLAIDEKSGNTGFGYFPGHQMAIAGDEAYLASDTALQKIQMEKFAKASRVRQEVRSLAYQINRELRSAKGEAAKLLTDKLKVLAAQDAELAGGGEVWKQTTTEDEALIAAGSWVIAGGDDTVTVRRAADGELVWQMAVEGRARGLAVVPGHLLVSTTAGHVYCFAGEGIDLPPAKYVDGTPSKPADPNDPKSPFAEDNLSETYREAALQILGETGKRQGFCMVLGSEEGRLAYEIARRSDLQILCVEPDAEKAKRSREALAKAGLYGTRVVVLESQYADIPFANYFANLVVSDRLIADGTLPENPQQFARFVKPVGGQVYLGRPDSAKGEGPTTDAMQKWMNKLGLANQSTIETEVPWVKLTRAELPGAGSWTHQYAEPGNTAVSDDKIVSGGLGVLWYGDPGPGKMVNRHEGAVGPLAVAGKLIVQGENSIMAYDAYNGQFLWEKENPEALRTGVFQNNNPGNLASTDERLFMLADDKCVEFDLNTGEILRTHELPQIEGRDEMVWGYLAVHEGKLFGTATRRTFLDARLRRRGKQTDEATDVVFALDLTTGKHLWHYQGSSVSPQTIALGKNAVYFIDSSLTAEQRDVILRQDKTELAKLVGQEAVDAERRAKEIDVRRTVAVNATTGAEQWSKLVDVTDCSEIGIGGGKLTLMFADGKLIICGANANGHYWTQFLAGDFSQRRLLVLDAKTGAKLWVKDANYRHRPIVVQDRIIAEPWAFELATGEQILREHPVTGEKVPWSIIRPGHHCGMISGCTNMLLFRSGYTGFYDLEEDAGTRHFAGHRLGCWINAVPANGLVTIPEASAGCVCLFSIASTITLEPREAKRPWTIYSTTGATTPVKHLSLNLGAPGDRRDALGKIWLAWPRPSTSKETGLDLKLGIQQKWQAGGGMQSLNEESLAVTADTPWLYTSWAQGLDSLTVPLRGENDGPARYRVKLYFAEVSDSAGSALRPGERMFDVRLNGETLLEKFDIAAAAADAAQPNTDSTPTVGLVRTIGEVDVERDLQIQLVPHGSLPPVLSAVEVQRVD